MRRKEKPDILLYTVWKYQIGIDATSIDVKETEDEIRAEVKYALDVNYEFVGDCHINIAVKKKGATVKIA